MNNAVAAIVVDGERMYAGGSFTNAGGNALADYLATCTLRGLNGVYLPLVVR